MINDTICTKTSTYTQQLCYQDILMNVKLKRCLCTGRVFSESINEYRVLKIWNHEQIKDEENSYETPSLRTELLLTAKTKVSACLIVSVCEPG